jgi:hypothetical protein
MTDLGRLGSRLLLAAAWILIGVAAISSAVIVMMQNPGGDAHAYWLASRTGDLYSRVAMSKDAYLYSPLFAQLIWPLAQLPWPAFGVIWVGLEAAAFVWLVAPLPWRWAVPALLLTLPELALGNVVGFLAIACVLGMSRSAWWSAGALTKVTPGVLGFAWFAGRGEWRKAAAIVAVSGALAAVSFTTWPSAWEDWLRFLTTSDKSPGLEVRTVAAIALMVVGGRRGWWWAPAVAVCAVTPVFGGIQPLCYLLMLPRLWQALRGSTGWVGREPRLEVAALSGGQLSVKGDHI